MGTAMAGPYGLIFWLLICNVIIPQALWSARVRRNHLALCVIVALSVNVGMWVERIVIVITSLHRDFVPTAWGQYGGTRWDYATFWGTVGLFMALIFLFVRLLPAISMTEMRELVHEREEGKS